MALFRMLMVHVGAAECPDLELDLYLHVRFHFLHLTFVLP